MSPSDALVQPVGAIALLEDNRRATIRHACSIEATSRSLNEVETISWGAVVDDISAGGVGIILCFPFRPGTYLSIDLSGANGMVRTVMVRVVHVRDRADGTWQLGCEFVKPLANGDIDMLL